MEMTKFEIDVPKEMVPFLKLKGLDTQTKRIAMLLFPYIDNNTISYGKAAEMMGMNKLDLIDLYEAMGLPYFNMDIDEIEEDVENIKMLRRNQNDSSI